MNNQCRAISDGKISEFVHGRLHPEEALCLLNAIEQDPEASANLDLQVEVLNIAHSPDAEAFRANRKPNGVQVAGSSSGALLCRWPLGARSVLVPAFVLLAGIVAGFAVITTMLATSNPLGDLAELGELSSSFRLRSLGSADLTEAAIWLVNGEPGEAARRFERHLKMYPSEEWAPWVEYAAGLSRLAEARRSFLGIRISYNADLVRKGLGHLDRVLASAGNLELREDALWYRAKGYLMLGDARSATVCLTQVQSLLGTRSLAAGELLFHLHSLQN